MLVIIPRSPEPEIRRELFPCRESIQSWEDRVAGSKFRVLLGMSTSLVHIWEDCGFEIGSSFLEASSSRLKPWPEEPRLQKQEGQGHDHRPYWRLISYEGAESRWTYSPIATDGLGKNFGLGCSLSFWAFYRRYHMCSVYLDSTNHQKMCDDVYLTNLYVEYSSLYVSSLQHCYHDKSHKLAKASEDSDFSFWWTENIKKS